MRVRAALAGLLLAAVAAAQPALAPPRIGCYRDAENRLRPLLGVAGTFLAGEPIERGVLAAACDARRTLLKTADALELREGGLVVRWDAPAGKAALALGDGSATACFPQQCWRLRPGFDPLIIPLDGEPLAVAWPRVVVRRDARLWLLEFPDRAAIAERELRAVPAPVLLLPDGTLAYADGDELVLRAPQGEERRIAVRVALIETVGEGWIRVRDSLAVEAASGTLYWLPEAPR